jgi:hypothetical protein
MIGKAKSKSSGPRNLNRCAPLFELPAPRRSGNHASARLPVARREGSAT